MTDRDDARHPVVDRLKGQLRDDLMRAVAESGRRPSRRIRRRVVAAAVMAVVAMPAGLAAAGVFQSPDVEFECPQAAEPTAEPSVALAPAEGPDGVDPAIEPDGPPANPCD
ncbi:MAG TPA: hypothetical protein VNO82_08625 [Solirubrobacteraceae bacterium]|nr:hypothetical protein [Solirubrobacteraceae bacterium]